MENNTKISKHKTKKLSPNFTAKIGDVNQSEIFNFRCTPGSQEVFRSYAENLKLNQTELFYRIIHHLASQGRFIEWFEQNQKNQVDANPEWFKSWKIVSRLCENLILLNDGRVKQIENKTLDTTIADEISSVLHKHYTKKI